MTATAERWWVALAARWLARIDAVSGQLRLLMLGVTGASTGLVALDAYGLRGWAIPLLTAAGLAMLGYTYAYAEGGVWNQVQRDKNDMSSNHAHPGHVIDDSLIGRSVAAAIQGEPLDEDQREAVRRELADGFEEFRDGVDVENGKTQERGEA